MSPALLKATIARALSMHNFSRAELGSVTLAQHQHTALSQIKRSLEEFGGAVLCDPVGTGKTFTALAAAPTDTVSLVIAPAALRSMWAEASERAARSIEFISFESLSRSSLPRSNAYALIIVDEAHHLRNPASIRYAAACRLAPGGRILMLTATPIHNRRRDLTNLLRIFLGERAADLGASDLARCVIRRENLVGSTRMPLVAPIVWHHIETQKDVPNLLLSLPPPLGPSDGGDGGSLLIHSLVRQWASSNAALEGALRRRLTQSSALIAALEDGTWPSRRDLGSWIGGSTAVQLALTGLLAPVANNPQQLLAVVIRHCDAVRDVLARVRAETSADDERALIIQRVRDSNSQSRVVAFSAYSDTVHAMFKRLEHSGFVAALTSRGARVSGGNISRREAIERFAPTASRCAPPSRANAITLLLTTDLLSEGVNLQDANVVIHLDLPWTPARMEQRVGRAARIGSHHARVVSHAIHPPASAEFFAKLESILRDKFAEGRGVALPSPYLAGSFGDGGAVNPSTVVAEQIRQLVDSWCGPQIITSEIAVASVVARKNGFLALCCRNGTHGLVGSIENTITDDPQVILECLIECGDDESKAATASIEETIERLTEWLVATSALGAVQSQTSQRRTLAAVSRRVAREARRVKAHERTEILSMAAQARAALRGRHGEFVERQLEEHLSSGDRALSWMKRLLEMLAATRDAAENASESSIQAMLLFRKRNALSDATKR